MKTYLIALLMVSFSGFIYSQEEFIYVSESYNYSNEQYSLKIPSSFYFREINDSSLNMITVTNKKDIMVSVTKKYSPIAGKFLYNMYKSQSPQYLHQNYPQIDGKCFLDGFQTKTAEVIIDGIQFYRINYILWEGEGPKEFKTDVKMFIGYYNGYLYNLSLSYRDDSINSGLPIGLVFLLYDLKIKK